MPVNYVFLDGNLFFQTSSNSFILMQIFFFFVHYIKSLFHWFGFLEISCLCMKTFKIA